MKMELRGVEFPGSLERERVVLRARAETEVANFAVFACEVNSKGALLGGNLEHAFWFGSQQMKPGDLAIVYTKKGSRSKKENSDGSASYFFYWGADTPIWSGGDLIPVLVYTPEWEYQGDDSSTQEPMEKRTNSVR